MELMRKVSNSLFNTRWEENFKKRWQAHLLSIEATSSKNWKKMEKVGFEFYQRLL